MGLHKAFQEVFRALEPEQIDGLLRGYYDGDTMTIHPFGIEVQVTRMSVTVPREIYEEVKKKWYRL